MGEAQQAAQERQAAAAGELEAAAVADEQRQAELAQLRSELAARSEELEQQKRDVDAAHAVAIQKLAAAHQEDKEAALADLERQRSEQLAREANKSNIEVKALLRQATKRLRDESGQLKAAMVENEAAAAVADLQAENNVPSETHRRRLEAVRQRTQELKAEHAARAAALGASLSQAQEHKELTVARLEQEHESVVGAQRSVSAAKVA